MPNKRTHKTQKRILAAATQVVLEQGIENMTLDAVAKVAEISKGGLLYHFKSKYALVAGMIAHHFDEFEVQFEEELKHHDTMLEAYAAIILNEDELEAQMTATLMAAYVNEPELLTVLQGHYQQLQDRLLEQSSLKPIEVIVIRLLLDGWWFSRVFGLAPLTDNQNEALHQYIKNLIKSY